MTQTVAPFCISRVFNALCNLVFEVHTDADHLQKWMSPEGFKTIHAAMDFRVGGTYHYGLERADGMQMWGKQVFREIVPNERLTSIQSFSDKNGGNTRHPMSPAWPLEMLATTTFEDIDGTRTKVAITWQPWNSDEAGHCAFDAARSGMERGFGGMFAQLEAYLNSQRAV
ncbi:SRPBCC domain-containing protein [Verminephrobacter eiseniae]|uniref:SRPBCC family protein n=1 Tax=Verminephrobacter eiseniae TaxID=364317 RepID=UPI0022376E2E|nr:SRPBCC domain-containing protein [Verminephrobacter eiseniae]MCW5259198.1 SRPBCC domain-containing protein [Verminephrobacter eiseniae]